MTMDTMNNGATSHHDTDTALLETPDFFAAGSDYYYRQPDTGRVFLIQIEADDLDAEALDAAELEGANHDDDPANDIDTRVDLTGLRIAEVDAAVLSGAEPVSLETLAGDCADWLGAVADAIDEAGGVPADVLPPIPASTVH